MRAILALAVASALLPLPAQAAQITVAPGNAVASSGDYSGQFAFGSIFDNQTGPVSEPGQAGYWLNPDNGPANAFITIDLGSSQTIGAFELFNTHNSFYNDRGTGSFSIIGSNTLNGDGSLGGAITLVSGVLNAVSLATDPITSQIFNLSVPAAFQYLQFLPTSVATAPDGIHTSPCCGDNVYGLNELRIYDTPFAAAAPEPAAWALMLAGFGLVGTALRRRRRKVVLA